MVISTAWSGICGATKVSEADMEATVVQLDGVSAIAVIDDAFEPVSSLKLPAQEDSAVLSLLTDLNEPNVVEDLAQYGIDQEALRREPYKAIEALTSPERDLGEAYAVLAGVSATLERYIAERHTMRRIVEAMRKATGCQVVEFTPKEKLQVQDKQLIFIDYYLEKDKVNGELAEEIANQIEKDRVPGCMQQIVLMSSVENVRTFRKTFRRSTGVQGSAFSFVAKADLDEPWKVRAHLKMFSRALPYSQVIGEYVASAKESVERAGIRLIEVLDDLDLGDFAYIQKLSLHADGHPLGDYLSWLFSSHLAALAFEHELREQQAKVDKVEFDEVLISPVEPSTVVAMLYHDAQFARNVGPLGPHPRAVVEGEFGDVPLVRLGDVFLDKERTKAVVVLSADCDLAFAPIAERSPNRSTPVLLVEGEPQRIDFAQETSGDSATQGLGHGSEVYRIDWKFKSYRTVSLETLESCLVEIGVDVSERERLRPLYALKLQHDFGKQLLRAGLPVMPPFRKEVGGEILKWMEEMEEMEQVDELDDLHLSATLGEKINTIRITPALAGRLKTALSNLCRDLQESVEPRGSEEEDGENQGQTTPLQHKLEAISKVLDDEEKWINLLDDVELPKPNTAKKLTHGLRLVRGNEWQPSQGEPTIVLRVIDVDVELN